MVYRVTAVFPKEELYGLWKRLGFLGNPDSFLIEQKIVETEKILSSLIRWLRIETEAVLTFSLQSSA